MDACFAAVHRLGTPDDGLGPNYPRCSEVELRHGSLDLLERFLSHSCTRLRGMNEYIRQKIVWLSPSILIVNTEGPFDIEFLDNHDVEFYMDVQCGSGWASQEDLSISVCTLRSAGRDVSNHCMDTLLCILKALSISAVGFYGDLDRSLDRHACKFPFTPEAIDDFLRNIDDPARISISNFKFDRLQIAALGAVFVKRLKLAFLELEDSFSYTVRVGTFEVEISDTENHWLWLIGPESQVTTLIVRTRQRLLAPMAMDSAELSVSLIQSLARLVTTIRPLNVCIRASWLSSAESWTVISQHFALLPSVQAIQIKEFFPMISPKQRQSICSGAILALVQQNQVICEVEIPIQCRDEKIWEKGIEPCLSLNKLRPRIQALLSDRDLVFSRSVISRLIVNMSGRSEQIYYALRSTCHMLVL